MTAERQSTCEEIRKKLGWLVNELYGDLRVAIDNKASASIDDIRVRIGELVAADRHVSAAMFAKK